MIKLLRLAVALVAGIVFIGFAFFNRTPVPISLGPFSDPTELPLYGVLWIGLVLGAILGVGAAWLSGHRTRSEASRFRRRSVALEQRDEIRRKQEEEALTAKPTHTSGSGRKLAIVDTAA